MFKASEKNQIILGFVLAFFNLVIYADQFYQTNQTKKSSLPLAAIILTLIGESLWVIYAFKTNKTALFIDKNDSSDFNYDISIF